MESLNVRLWKSTDIEEIRQLIKDGANVNYRNSNNFPLVASKHNSVEKLTILLENGADANTYIDDDEGYPIHYIEDLNKLEIYIKFGADINLLDGLNRTGLCRAIDRKHHDKAKFLIEKGGDVNLGDHNQDTPLILSKCPEVTKALIEAGARLEDTGAYGRNALMRADTEKSKILIKAGAKVNIIDNDHMNALMLVVRSDYTDKVELLLKSGINVNQRNLKGETALMLASNSTQRKLLLEYGADPNIHDDEGFSFLAYCEEHEKPLFKHLVEKKQIPNIKEESSKVYIVSIPKGSSINVKYYSSSDSESED